jgi:hypothetical protein
LKAEPRSAGLSLQKQLPGNAVLIRKIRENRNNRRRNRLLDELNKSDKTGLANPGYIFSWAITHQICAHRYRIISWRQ